MPLTTAPRALGKLQYRILRSPSLFLEQRYLSRLPDDNPRRLLIERALGSVDSLAGRVLADEQLAARGATLVQRAETFRRARDLEQSAASQRAQARDDLEQQQKAAEQERSEAVQRQQQEIAEARQEEQQAKQQAREEAERLASEKQKKADEKADQRLSSVSSTREQRESQLNQREKSAAEQRKEKVNEAQTEAQAADTERAKAERLDDLADQERKKRTQPRGQRSNA